MENEYEAERARRIAENKAKMAQLGLADASAAVAKAADIQSMIATSFADRPRTKTRKPSGKRRSSSERQTRPASLRESKRLRGYTAPAPADAAAGALLEAAAEAATAVEAAGPLGTTTKGKPRKAITLPKNTVFAAPFTLRSIGTTILELGAVHRGEWAQLYWSNRGCLHHHAYPVGYRATKEMFGRTYEMCIDAGATGPVFSVRDLSTGRRFSGTSPTKPWTDVCIAQKTGQRISGPLFFGFSDPLTQQAIAKCLYNERELAAALAGEVVEAEELSPEEQAAKEIEVLEGVGEKTAMILARTTALGGQKHSGIASMKRWVVESDENAATLLNFLLTSEEIPEMTRRWHAWSHRIAARIVGQLLGDKKEAAEENVSKKDALEERILEEEAAPKENVEGELQQQQQEQKALPAGVIRSPGNSKVAA
ncbi:hypothetical protein Ndes2526B_g01307 [Nannochloris sp. 'desiccata']|nr:hypothetical protein KSW81_004358 [Chlorella desiccata (nom. nud.)]KAH7624055.1 hypothetical protein NADE_008867 [Chlorella desiccata (nom. nud.)]